jgi:hypothetical protein
MNIYCTKIGERDGKRRNFILEELLVTCALGGPGHQKTGEHPDIPAGH